MTTEQADPRPEVVEVLIASSPRVVNHYLAAGYSLLNISTEAKASQLLSGSEYVRRGVCFTLARREGVTPVGPPPRPETPAHT